MLFLADLAVQLASLGLREPAVAYVVLADPLFGRDGAQDVLQRQRIGPRGVA